MKAEIPSKSAKIVIPPMRGAPQYDRYLDRLQAEARKRGVAVESRSKLIEIALAALGAQWGLLAPQRVNAHGTNRYGPPTSSE